MKLLMILVPDEHKEELETRLVAAGLGGYTEIPHAVGRGLSGPRLGSGAFPRTSAVVFTLVADDEIPRVREELASFGRTRGERLHMVAWDAEEVA